MSPFFEHGLRITWLAVLGYWLWAARTAKPAVNRSLSPCAWRPTGCRC